MGKWKSTEWKAIGEVLLFVLFLIFLGWRGCSIYKSKQPKGAPPKRPAHIEQLDYTEKD